MNSSNDSMRAALRTLRHACVASIVLVAGCGDKTSDPAAKSATAPAAIPVTVKRVEPQRVAIALEAVGQAEGSREVEIRARVSGILEKRLYTEGAPVKAGQTLFVIDRAQYEIAAAQAQAALAQERVRQEQARREAERLKPLSESRAISQREYDEALSTLKQSTAAIEGAQARIDEAKLNLSYTLVSAPIGGITSRALRSEGSLVAANTDLLTTIIQVHPIWIRFSLAEADFERIRGHERRAQVQLLTQDGAVAANNGRLNFAASTVDPKLGTVQLRAEFPNERQRWLPGQFVRVQIFASEQEAFLVPQAAVVQTEQTRAVWIAAADGKAVMKPVQTGHWIGSDWVIIGGLQRGDPVIVDNLIKLRPGAPITPRSAGAADGPGSDQGGSDQGRTRVEAGSEPAAGAAKK
ncbi:MAG: efflux RND transporter periplasmic adaptor subunit [Burkholderiales bacterium]|nr:efflux RND transporter periplasmic adaptor subunit [Burkholderiales bacterium]